MNTFNVRFNLSPAGSGSMQNPARCVAVSAANADAAIGRVHRHYAEKGRSPKVYAIEIDGVWRKVDFGMIGRVEAMLGPMSGEGYEIGEAFKSAPKEIPVETPEWAA